MKLSFLSLKFIFNLLKGKITNRLNAVLACLFVKKFHKKVYFHKVYFYYWSFKALKVANIFNLLYGIAKKNYNLHTFMIFFNKCFQSDGTKTVLCNKILELLLDSLCSKTLSAPSFGHYWKQLIGSPYWSTASTDRVNNMNPKYFIRLAHRFGTKRLRISYSLVHKAYFDTLQAKMGQLCTP